MPNVFMSSNKLHMLDCRKGETTGAIIIGEILVMHIHEGVAGKSPTGKTIVDIDKYQPISRLGGNFYGRIKEIVELPRPTDEECARRCKEYKEQVSMASCACTVWLEMCKTCTAQAACESPACEDFVELHE